MMSAPAAKLDYAVLEAIQNHADHYANGVVTVDYVLAALAEVTADFLAQIQSEREREVHRRALFTCITTTTIAKWVEQQRDNTIPQ